MYLKAVIVLTSLVVITSMGKIGKFSPWTKKCGVTKLEIFPDAGGPRKCKEIQCNGAVEDLAHPTNCKYYCYCGNDAKVAKKRSCGNRLPTTYEKGAPCVCVRSAQFDEYS